MLLCVHGYGPSSFANWPCRGLATVYDTYLVCLRLTSLFIHTTRSPRPSGRGRVSCDERQRRHRSLPTAVQSCSSTSRVFFHVYRRTVPVGTLVSHGEKCLRGSGFCKVGVSASHFWRLLPQDVSSASLVPFVGSSGTFWSRTTSQKFS